MQHSHKTETSCNFNPAEPVRPRLPRSVYQQQRERAIEIVSRGTTEDELLIAMVMYARNLEALLEQALDIRASIEMIDKEVMNL